MKLQLVQKKGMINLKKVIIACLISILVFGIFPVSVYAKNKIDDEIPISEEFEIDEKTYGIYNTCNDTDINSVSTKLIINTFLKLSKSSGKLIISAKTVCVTGVKKCGFTYIKLQRQINGNWMDYTPCCYYEQYTESVSYSFNKTVSVPKGYKYRVVCEHYAQKSKMFIFKDTEKSYNETSAISL